MKIEQPTQMRDGSTADDPRLGRLPSFDERSRKFGVQERLETAGDKIATRSWSSPFVLDQGQTSACTGFSRTYDLAGSPKSVKYGDGSLIGEEFAQKIYAEAKRQDEWPGEDYEGSSVLGALKAAATFGLIGEYRWAFNMDDMLAALSTLGPVVVGTTWYNSMFEPRPSGLLEVDAKSGDAGGHAYYFRRILTSEQSKRQFLGRTETLRSEPLLVVRNSWGTSWGRGGEAGMWADDYEDSLFKGGEQSVILEALAPAFRA